MAIATLGGLKSSPKAIPAPLTFVVSRLGRVTHLEALCHRSPRTDRSPRVAEPYAWSSLVIFRLRPTSASGPCALTDSTGSRRLVVVGKLGATVLPDSGSTTSLGRWGRRVLPGPGSWCRPDPSFMADASNYRLLLSLVVNLELMDVVKEKK